MSKRVTEIEVVLSATSQELEDRYAFTSNELGFTVYGKTEEEAKKEFAGAFLALINSFKGDVSGLRAFLDEHQVRHTIDHPAAKDAKPSLRPPQVRDIPLKVPVGAAQ